MQSIDERCAAACCARRGDRMTAEDEIFNGEMERAYSRWASKDVYWSGYAAGLMRARFGSLAVGDQYHDEWRQGDPPDERARGYRDGYAKLERLAPASPWPAVGDADR